MAIIASVIQLWTTNNKLALKTITHLSINSTHRLQKRCPHMVAVRSSQKSFGHILQCRPREGVVRPLAREGGKSPVNPTIRNSEAAGKNVDVLSSSSSSNVPAPSVSSSDKVSSNMLSENCNGMCSSLGECVSDS